MDKNTIIQVGKAILAGTVPEQYSKDSGISSDQAMRNAFSAILGLNDGEPMTKKAFRANKTKVFEILEEVIEVKVNEGFTNILEQFVEYKNLALGDKNEFIIPDNQYFRVATISEGNGNLRRQRMRDGQKFQVPTHVKGVKIYEEFDRFMAGRVDFLEMTNRVAESMLRQVKEEIYRAVLTNFTEAGSDTTYRKTITGALPTEKDIMTMAKHLEAKTGATVVIYGTALALANFDIKFPSDASNNTRNQQGFYGRIAGIEAVEVPALHEVGTDDFIFEDDAILLLPQTGDKFIKVVNEGEAYIEASDSVNREDLQAEYLFTQKLGISTIPSSVFGFIKFAG